MCSLKAASMLNVSHPSYFIMITKETTRAHTRRLQGLACLNNNNNPSISCPLVHPQYESPYLNMYFTFLLLKITDLLFLRLYFYDIEFGQSFSCLIFHRGRRLRPKEPVMVSSRKGSIFVRVAGFWCCHETSQIPEKLLLSYQFCSTLLCASLHRKNRMLRRFFKKWLIGPPGNISEKILGISFMMTERWWVAKKIKVYP